VAVRTRYRAALLAGSSERRVRRYGRTGAEWGRRKGAGWESPVEHAAGITGLGEPDDEDTGTGCPLPGPDGP